MRISSITRRGGSHLVSSDGFSNITAAWQVWHPGSHHAPDKSTRPPILKDAALFLVGRFASFCWSLKPFCSDVIPIPHIELQIKNRDLFFFFKIRLDPFPHRHSFRAWEKRLLPGKKMGWDAYGSESFIITSRRLCLKDECRLPDWKLKPRGCALGAVPLISTGGRLQKGWLQSPFHTFLLNTHSRFFSPTLNAVDSKGPSPTIWPAGTSLKKISNQLDISR